MADQPDLGQAQLGVSEGVSSGQPAGSAELPLALGARAGPAQGGGIQPGDVAVLPADGENLLLTVQVDRRRKRSDVQIRLNEC